MSTNSEIVSIVDDDPGTTMFFHEALKNIPGIKISTFTDSIAAFEHFQVNDYAYVLVISDYKMPGLNGMELLKKIKDSNRFVRTILTIAFEEYFAFDLLNEYDKQALLLLLQNTEKVFQDAGYKLASIVPNNLKQLANTKK